MQAAPGLALLAAALLQRPAVPRLVPILLPAPLLPELPLFSRATHRVWLGLWAGKVSLALSHGSHLLLPKPSGTDLPLPPGPVPNTILFLLSGPLPATPAQGFST